MHSGFGPHSSAIEVKCSSDATIMSYSSAQEAYSGLAQSFERDNPKSKAIYDQATQSLPGGNTRSVLYYHPFPLSVSSAQGARLLDVDDHKYVDLLGEYTAGLYGHSEPAILGAIAEAAKRGLNFGSQHAVSDALPSFLTMR